jgi:hypothetical protein
MEVKVICKGKETIIDCIGCVDDGSCYVLDTGEGKTYYFTKMEGTSVEILE